MTRKCSVQQHPRPYWAEARAALAGADPVLAGIIKRTDDKPPEVRDDAFTALARSIVGQQVSVHAARAIWQRMVIAVKEITPSAFASTSEETLRMCGISQRKATYLQTLSAHFIEGPFADASWRELEDQAIVELLCEIKGVGRWTSEMFLIFHLCRPDVFSFGDAGLQRAIRLHYGKGRALSEKRVEKLTRVWAPWRSVAAVYLWRSLEIEPANSPGD